MQYDPRLKIAMEEIKAIIKKHDVAAFVLIHKPGFSEYLNDVSPSYSCAKLESDAIRFKLKASEVGGKEKAKEIASNTYNMITHFSDVLSMNAMNYINSKEMLKKQWQGEDFDSEHTSNNQQNN